jgi:hypothetical protein
MATQAEVSSSQTWPSSQAVVVGVGVGGVLSSLPTAKAVVAVGNENRATAGLTRGSFRVSPDQLLTTGTQVCEGASHMLPSAQLIVV